MSLSTLPKLAHVEDDGNDFHPGPLPILDPHPLSPQATSMPITPHTLYLLAGPTAVGKTALALDWAEANGAQILSCDASCVYEGMDIGTAKPTEHEQARVPHHGLDLIPAAERFSVGRYARYAREVVEEVNGRGKPLLVVGGSGLYLQSFLRPVVDEIPLHDEVRQTVAAIEEAGGLTALLEELDKRNPSGTGDLDRLNPRRVAAALTRCLATGKTVEELQQAYREAPDPFAGWQRRLVLLERGDADLRQRIEQRTQQMLAAGFIEEVQRLREAGFEANPSAARAIGYREVLSYLDGELTEEALPEAISRSTWQLVRKQRAWFRHQVTPACIHNLDTVRDFPIGELFPA